MSCSSPLDPDSTLVLREVVGFTQHRSQGGANQIIGRRETGRVLCPNCGLRLQQTGIPTQSDLFGAPVEGPVPPTKPIADWPWLR